MHQTELWRQLLFTSVTMMMMASMMAKKYLGYWTNTIISDWFLSHGMFVMMMTIMSEQGTLLIISQIYFHLLRQRSIHNVIKTIWIWFYQASLSEMIIKLGIRGLAWGKPRHRLESLPLSSMGDRYTQRQMVESQKKTRAETNTVVFCCKVAVEVYIHVDTWLN